MSEQLVKDGFKEIPSTMPVIPLSGTVIYPFMVVPFFVQGARNEKAIDAAMNGDHFIFAAALKEQPPDDEEPGPQHIHTVGAVASVLRMMRVPTGGIKIMVQGLFRGVADKIQITENEFISADIQLIDEPEVPESQEVRALMRTVTELVERSVQFGKTLPPEFLAMIKNLKEPGRLADLVASTIDLEPGDAQTILEQFDTMKRLEFVNRLLTNEVQILEIQNKIKTNVQSEIEDSQKKYFLREQMKAIQKELGQKDPQDSEVEELRRAVKEAAMPEEARKQAMTEIDRLSRMHPDAAESNVIRTYIDWMISLPWNKPTKDRLDLDLARETLDNDHFGLEKVKDRIIQTLAVRKLNPSSKGPILCFVGPPGVGKTSLGQSIARALDRKFFRLSVGGVRDEAEIRGHRRTYVGALPGRIINGLKIAGSNNPVFMIDEIDKIGSDYRGDPSSALLEVLDPEQNSTFADHYIDVPFDLSNVMFITTANVLDTIPGPLLDRMEVIQIPGYTEDEKVAIAQRYLVPRRTKASGLDKARISLSTGAIRGIIRGYTREAGVRNLEREIGTVCRKVATRVARGTRIKKFGINGSNLGEYLGAPSAGYSPACRRAQIGVVNGLAWTPTGGEVLVIEAILMEGKRNLILTGQLGDVMKESAQAALSYVRSRAKNLGFVETFDDKKDIHIHVPAGATPKDGPSAGVAMTSVLLSLFMKKPIRCDIAMTGEISLRGAVLPIGGLKQKLLAARREGIMTVLVPAANKNDIADLGKNDIKGLNIIFISTIDDMLPHIFAERTSKARKRNDKIPSMKKPPVRNIAAKPARQKPKR